MTALLDNRYRILSTLGSGGFGQTFLAEDIRRPAKRQCVVKQLKPQTKDPSTYQIIEKRFEREAIILERLGDSHDQIPELYAYFSEDNEFYLVQELIKGRNLLQKVNEKGAFNEREVKAILVNLLGVLDYIHSQGVIHRDIKPENIILRDEDNKPVLIDFGAVKEEVSKIISSNDNSQTIVIGTPNYMAPEQAAGNPLFASDLYSLGLTAIFLLTGRQPATMKDHTSGKFNWHKYTSNVSQHFAAIIDKAIQSAAKNRYQTAREMLKAIQPPIVPVQPKKSSTTPIVYIAIAILIIILIGGGLVLVRLRAQEQAIAERRIHDIETKAEQERRETEEARKKSEEDAKKKFEEERAAREAAEARQQELEQYAVTATIQSVWVDHNVFENDVKGMRIHVKFSINNLQQVPCTATAYFYLDSGEALRDFNHKYNTTDGHVSVSTSFTPGYVNTSYNDLQLFMPYSELHMNKGTYQLKFFIQLFRRGNYYITQSSWQTFQYSS